MFHSCIYDIDLTTHRRLMVQKVFIFGDIAKEESNEDKNKERRQFQIFIDILSNCEWLRKIKLNVDYL